MRMKAAYPLAVLGALAITTDTVAAEQTTHRVACEKIRGQRIQYFDNDTGPKSVNKKVVNAADEITGLKIELTFSAGSTDATAVFRLTPRGVLTYLEL